MIFIDLGSPSTVTFKASAPSAQKILSLDYLQHLRPSTVVNYLISCSPPQLPSPFDLPGENQAAYIEKLTELVSSSTASNNRGRSNDECADESSGRGLSVRQLFVNISSNTKASMAMWKTIPNEQRNWECAQQALDTFFQRISVIEGKEKHQMRGWYETIVEIGTNCFGT